MRSLTPVSLALAALLFGCSSDFGAGDTGDDPGGDIGGDTPDNPDSKPGDDPYPGCPSVTANITAEIPTVMLLVDRSGTMEEGFGGGLDRWEAVYATLLGSPTALVPQLDNQVDFGLATYTGRPDLGCPLVDQIDPARNNFSAIDTAYRSTSPLKDTPTGESLDLVRAGLASLQTTGPKAIVVATDGLPDSCANPDDNNAAARKLAVDAASRAFNEGIEVYIISVGNDVSDAHLQEMANAGVGLAPQGAQNAPYYRALNTQQLEDAFSGIIAGVRGCSFDLDQAVADAATGTVTLDGRELEKDVDWQITGDTTLELIGDACDELLDGGDHDVDAVFECGGNDDGIVVE